MGRSSWLLAVPLGFVAMSALVAVVVSLATAAIPKGGDLDPSFGSRGLVTTELTSTSDIAYCVAVQPDGKIVVAGAEGSGDTSAGHTFVARYLPNGTLDSTFGGGGVVRPQFSSEDNIVQGLAIQPDGKIVAVGSVLFPDTNMALTRLNPDGSLDASFGGSGKVITGLAPSSRERALAVAIAPDGKIIVAGAARGGGLPPGNFLVARFNGDGSLDSTFGGSGTAIADFGSLAEAHAVAIDAGGKILAVGGMFSVSPAGAFWGRAFVSARYNTDGSLDGSFGGGKVSTDFDTDSYANDVAVQHDGKIVTVGWVGGTISSGTLVRHNPDGGLDESFGDGGKAVLQIEDSGAFLGALALDRRGRILAAGNAGRTSADFALARFTADGKPDREFGSSGAVSTDFGGNLSDNAYDMALQRDGKVILVGESDGRVALARYLPTYCIVPNVIGKTLTAAKTGLSKRHCTSGKITRASSETVRAGRVLRQTPRAGVQRQEDAAVALVLSRGR